MLNASLMAATDVRFDDETCAVCADVSKARASVRATTVAEHVKLKQAFLSTWKALQEQIDSVSPRNVIAEFPPDHLPQQLWGYFEAIYLQRDPSVDRESADRNLSSKKSEFSITMSYLGLITEADREFLESGLPTKINEELNKIEL